MALRKFKESILSGDDLGIVTYADEVLEIFNNINKDEKWKYLRIVSTENKIEYIVEKKYQFFNKISDLVKPYDSKSIYLEPWDLSKLRKSIQFAEFERKYGDMAVINGLNRPWVTLIMFYFMFGVKMLQSRITQIFLQYLDLFTAEPFNEIGNGAIIRDPLMDDAAVTLRVKLYIRTIWEEMTGKLDPIIALETFIFLFKNPQVNTLKIKDMKGTALQCSMAASTRGLIASWVDEGLSAFELKAAPKVNPDLSTWLRLEDTVRAELTQMAKEANMPTVAKRYLDMVSEPISYEGASDFSTFWFLEALSGIMRNDYAGTAEESIKSAREDKKFQPTNLMAGEYYNIWYSFLSKWMDELPESQEELLLEVISDLTTRSNGLNDTIMIDGELISNPDVYVVEIDVGIDGHPHVISWKFNDKAMTFRRSPIDMFDFDKMVNSLTFNDPGRLFARYVPARKVRMVYGVSIYRFISERYTRPLVDYLSKILYNNQPTSTLSIDTGRYFTDMGKYLFITGNLNTSERILLADFSAFDQTQVYENWRSIMVLAAKQVRLDFAHKLDKYKFDLLGGKTILDYLIANWESLDDAVFRINRGGGNISDLETGWLLSGENGTLVINTTANMSFVRAFIAILPVTPVTLDGGLVVNLGDYYSVESYKLQGDDQISVIPLKIKVTLENQIILETALLDLLASVAKSGGLKISVNKTGLRTGHFEFLKKAGLWGYPIPRYMQISLEESETLNRTNDPIERMRSRIGQYREYEFRGGNTMWALMRRYFEWNLIRTVDFGRNNNEERLKQELPYALIWTPISDGGVGMHPRTVVDPNADIMISMYPWHPEVRKEINACILALKSTPPKNNDFIVSEVKKHLEDGIKVEKHFDNIAHPNKIRDSIAAYERLKAKGMGNDRSAYFQRYDQEVKEAIEDDRKMEKVNQEWKRLRSRHIMVKFVEHMSEQNILDSLSNKFIPGVRYEYIDVVINGNIPICPVAGLDKHLQAWMQQIGTSSEERVITGNSFSKITKLLNRGNFPRNLKANNIENIASELLRLNFVETVDIADFLIMRGAETDSALSVASLLNKKMDMLKYLSDISAFSFVGEGFTDKSEGRINQLVKFAIPLIDNSTPFTQMIKAVAYQFLRTDDLWDYTRETGEVKTRLRRHVLIHINDETVLTAISKSLTTNTDILVKQMVRDGLFFAMSNGDVKRGDCDQCWSS
jgi:chorismate-pyruvate lyase